MSKRNDVSYDSSLILLRSPKANNFVRFNLNLTEFKSEKKTLQKVNQTTCLDWFIWLRDSRESSHCEHSIRVVKLPRAHGGCLGIRRL
jgi:hypothetical protein